ncbi:hypothetical protein BGZ70_001044 [Mortierella alpina]|uniref:PIPK domain-containing protein n=1 Tax=Mortierella alpina TaxID=64518 RepID=A0A9P6IX88_MORAP|nr:hypothetical protein BGZ70_001044 [Mortierella alpina]
MFSFLASTTASLRGAPPSAASASTSAHTLHPPSLPSRPSSPRPPSTSSTAAAAATTTEVATKSAHLDARSRQKLVALDQRSFQHLRAIARQSISSSCLENEILWQRLFMDTIQKLAANVAEVWQQIEAAADSTTADTPRASIEEATQISKPDAKPSKSSAATATTTASPVVDGTAGNRPSFRYRICLVKHTSSSRECSFTAGQFKGDSILLEERSTQEKRRPPKEDQASILLGGTIFLSAAPNDMPKVEKILEILVFAVCSLELEAYLMRDHGVIRPESTLNILSTHETDSRHSKSTTASHHNPLHHLKRVSKGSMFAGLFSRNQPVKYKKGTIQLAQDMEQGGKLENGRQHTPSNRLSGIFNPPDELGLGEDPHSIQNYRFAKIIQQVEKAIISISPDVVFPPPHLLLRLRDEEVIGPDSKRKSYTWEDVEFVAKKIGFGNRMSRINITGARFATVTSSDTLSNNNSIVAHSSRLPADSRAGLDHLMTNSNSLQGIFNHQSISFSYSYYWSATAAAPCIAPKLITVEYYRKEGQYEDMSLGEMIEYVCRRANSSCPDRTCGHKRMEHISTYTHGEGRINITVEQPRPDSVTDLESEEFAPYVSNNKTIAVWTRCKMCRERTSPKVLSRASRLYSFSKYLELLLYSQHFEPGPRPICSHTVTKDAMARCFIYRGLVVTFECETVDLFEMRISRLQVNEDYPTMPRFQPCDLEEDTHDYSTTHSASIGPSSHVSMASLAANSDYLKESDQSALLDTTRLEILHFYESCKKIIVAMEEHLGETKSTSKAQYSAFKAAKTFTTVDPAKRAALNQLDELGAGWKNEEFELYDQLRHIPISRLNDVRNRFKDCIKRTLRSMESWQKEHHLAALEASGKDAIEWCLPEYAQSDVLHTFPGTSVIVREDEPSSIIASALSCVNYLSLLSAICSRDGDQEGLQERAPRPPKKDKIFTARPTLRNSKSAGSATLATHKSGSSGSEGSTAVPSMINGSPGKGDTAESINQDDDDGDEEEDEEEEEDSFLVVDGYQTSVKFVQVSKVDFSSLMPNGTISPRSTIGLNFGSTRQAKNSMLGFEKKSDVARPMSMLALPNPAPSIVASPVSTPYSEKDQATSFFASPPTSRSTTPTPGAKPKNTFGYHTLTSGLSGTMKGLSLNALSEKIGSGFSSYGTASAHLEKSEKDYLNPDGTERSVREAMAAEGETESTIPSPHLKARFSHGKTSFSCTVYYAAEFDTLRRRCGIHQAYVPSLSRCTSWNANGGKSKSSFYKSKDDRFVVKQMVSSWNIAEKDELLKFAPKYFEYMEKSHDAPTVLAKIFGFYTFKIKNGDSGQVLKIDVLVMEHLFFNQKITRTFDLKGIQDRHAGSKAAPAGATSTTLWDGDFLEGRFNDRLLIYSHSKKIIRESLVNDTEFLAASNIMDYSLLVGVDDERKELVVGIVDFIGAYTWSKRIESRGKTTLRGAKDNVTVLPPQQYKARFREAMERYFLAVPDKWSKTAAEQEQEAKREAANTNVPSTIIEGSKEGTGTSEPEQTLKRKTSGYLEKMSKAILPSRTTDTAAAAAAAAKAPAMAFKDASHAASSDDLMDPDARVQKLPRVFHPLD